MSSFFVGSSRVKTTSVDYNAEGKWIDIWESKNPLPPWDEKGKFGLTYSATTREPSIFAETKESNESTLKGHEQDLSLLRWHDTGQEKVRVFAGAEFYWSNQMRKMALFEGVEKHLPKIFYFIRPETAYTSALHFLARELGGCDTPEKEHSWLVLNRQVHCLLTKFWSRLQEIHWSGMMSPGIPKEEKYRLLLELIGAYNFSSSKDGEVARGEDSLPVPHLSEAMLRQAGIILPDTMYNMDITPESEKMVQRQLQRTNLPGIPGDLPGLLHCWLCNKGFDTVKERRQHTKDTQEMCATPKCDGCGLKFSSGREYKIHAYLSLIHI